jgi:hypothetical protein
MGMAHRETGARQNVSNTQGCVPTVRYFSICFSINILHLQRIRKNNKNYKSLACFLNRINK